MSYKPWKGYGRKTPTKAEKHDIDAYKLYHGIGMSDESARGNLSMMNRTQIDEIKSVLRDPDSKHYRTPEALNEKEAITNAVNEKMDKVEDNIAKINAIIRKTKKSIKEIEDENWRF